MTEFPHDHHVAPVWAETATDISASSNKNLLYRPTKLTFSQPTRLTIDYQYRKRAIFAQFLSNSSRLLFSRSLPDASVCFIGGRRKSHALSTVCFTVITYRYFFSRELKVISGLRRLRRNLFDDDERETHSQQTANVEGSDSNCELLRQTLGTKFVTSGVHSFEVRA